MCTETILQHRNGEGVNGLEESTFLTGQESPLSIPMEGTIRVMLLSTWAKTVRAFKFMISG